MRADRVVRAAIGSKSLALVRIFKPSGMWWIASTDPSEHGPKSPTRRPKRRPCGLPHMPQGTGLERSCQRLK